MQAYEGFYENDKFYSSGKAIRAAGRHKAIITIMDETAAGPDNRLAEFDRLTDTIKGKEKTEKEQPQLGAAYALDADIISRFINGNEHVSDSIRSILAQGGSFMIPPSVYFEIRRAFIRKPSPDKERTFDCICALFPIGETNLAVWECAARIYADSRTSNKSVSDILTAAFCIFSGCRLVTGGAKRFDGIDGLLLADWKE